MCAHVCVCVGGPGGRQVGIEHDMGTDSCRLWANQTGPVSWEREDEARELGQGPKHARPWELLQDLGFYSVYNGSCWKILNKEQHALTEVSP